MGIPVNVRLHVAVERALIALPVKGDESTIMQGRILTQLTRIADILAGWTTTPAPSTTPHIEGGAFMFIVKDTQPDSRYRADFSVVDAEGQPVPDAKVKVAVASDNEAVVSLTPDDAANPMAGGIHFGAPGVANVTAQVSLEDGTLVGSFGAQFTVTAGDPSAIASGSFSVEGLTEQP